VVAAGQDGLVANTRKYLDGQALIGVNPESARHDGQLLPFVTKDLEKIVPEVSCIVPPRFSSESWQRTGV